MSKGQGDEPAGQPGLLSAAGPEYTSLLSAPMLAEKVLEMIVLPPFVLGKFELVETCRFSDDIVAFTAPVPGKALSAIWLMSIGTGRN